MNHNKISTIDPLVKLLNLKVLGLFYNDILDVEYAMSILMKCTKLRELSIDGNACARNPEFNYELLMRLPHLKVLDEEAVKELDRDVAEQYYEMYELPVPKVWKPEPATVPQSQLTNPSSDDVVKTKKCVRFNEVNVDDDEECGDEKELKKVKKQVEQLEHEKYKLEQQLTKQHYDEVYKENERLQKLLKNMHSLMEENELMRAELDVLRSSTFDERTAEVADDN